MKKSILFSVLVAMCALSANAQKLKGDVKALSGENVNVVFNYEGLLINGKAKQAYLDAEEKRSKEPEKFLEDWQNYLDNVFKATFITFFNGIMTESEVVAGSFDDADYTIKVDVKSINTGNFAGPFSKPSIVSAATVSFLKTGDATPLGSIEFKNVSATTSSVNPVTLARMTMSFGTLGERTAAIVKNSL
jgi:hypothetical protein